MPVAPLQEQAERFATQLDALLTDVLPPPLPQVAARQAGGRAERWIIAPLDAVGERRPKPIPLIVGGEHLADLSVSLRCGLDSRGRWLAVDESNITVAAVIDRTPLLRLHYRRGADSTPSAHLHVHAQRGALSHLLSRSGWEKAHAMDSLHLPLGGARFRPALEDVLEWLIRECGVAHRDGWEVRLGNSRAEWRQLQLAAAIRDRPDEAVRVLRELHYTIAEPPSGPAKGRPDALRRW